MTIDSAQITVQEQLQQLKTRQFIESSLESIQQEVDDALDIIASQLDAGEAELEELSSDVALPPQVRDAISSAMTKLEQISAALNMAQLDTVAQLVWLVKSALKNVLEKGSLPGELQRKAIFSSFFMATRYLSALRGSADGTESMTASILAPSFYQLASAGLGEFVDESRLAGVECQLLDGAKETLPAPADIANLRKLRKMYQVALIGLLQSANVSGSEKSGDPSEQLKVIAHVAERVRSGAEHPLITSVWSLILPLIEQFESGKLALTPQRRHFFARFDGLLRLMEKANNDPIDGASAERSVKELVYLLDIAEERVQYSALIDAVCQQSAAPWSEVDIEMQRSMVESGLTDALEAMTAGIRSQLDEVKLRLSAMADSEICQETDVDAMEENFQTVAAVFSFCGFKRIANDIQKVLQQVQSWRDHTPGHEAMLAVADQLLTVENAMASYSNSAAVPDELSTQDQALNSMAHQANQMLFEELRANIGLANRAIASYLDSNFDREHIANVADCLQAAVGGLKIVGADLAADLLAKCAEFVDEKYRSRLPGETNSLENLADSLISVDYLLHQLSIGQDGGPVMDQLLRQNLEAIDTQLQAA